MLPEVELQKTTHYRIHLLSECISPLTHMKGVEGNEAMINREPMDTPSGKRRVSFLSGNALRHKMIREPGGLWLIEQLGLRRQLSWQQINFLLHGGNLMDSTGREDTARIAEMQELFPFLRLLGGALPDQILTGSLLLWRGLLVCEENRRHLRLPEGYSLPVESLKPAEHYIDNYQYTRGDARQRTDWYDKDTRNPEDRSNLMIFSGEQTIRGSMFLHGCDIPHGSELELGVFFHSLQLWQLHGGVVGGQGSKGHGQLRTSVLGFDAGLIQYSIAKYVAHVAANIERCRNWLNSVFVNASTKREAKAASAEAKKKGGKKKATPSSDPAEVAELIVSPEVN